MQGSDKECRWQCTHWAADPDGEYCAHPEAFKHSVFGIKLSRALGPNSMYPVEEMKRDPAIGICGPDRKLWEERKQHI